VFAGGGIVERLPWHLRQIDLTSELSDAFQLDFLNGQLAYDKSQFAAQQGTGTDQPIFRRRASMIGIITGVGN
jgi:hypothetical protein